MELDRKPVSEEKEEYVRKLLLERISLWGICQAVGVSLDWLLSYLVSLYEDVPEHLNVSLEHADNNVIIQRLEVQADEMLSFVGNKKNKQWIWLAMDAKTRQVIAFYVGDGSKRSARKLWKAIPDCYKQKAIFHTDKYDSYLIELLDDNDAGVVAAVIDALGLLGDRGNVAVVLKKSKDEDFYVKGAVAVALGRLGDDDAFKCLVELLEDDTPIVQANPLDALADLGDPSAIEYMKPLENNDEVISGHRIGDIAKNAITRLENSRRKSGRRKIKKQTRKSRGKASVRI